jgi:hypothetical protein
VEFIPDEPPAALYRRAARHEEAVDGSEFCETYRQQAGDDDPKKDGPPPPKEKN